MTADRAHPGRCPVCRLPLRPADSPLTLLHTDLDRPEDDPRRTVHAACRPARRTA